MNMLLWVLQGVLGLKFISIAYTHGLGTKRPTMQPGMQRLGAAARPVLAALALGSLLGAAGLILPVVTAMPTWLTPAAAGLLALMLLPAAALHLKCRDKPNLLPGLVLFAMAAFVCYGRWVIAPF
jgi:hypothetical protein